MRNLGGLLIFLCLITPLPALAGIFINEIMYDLEGTDTGREWIEVANTGTEVVDLNSWKIFEADTNHRLSLVPDYGSGIVPSGGFAVIADNPSKFLLDWPGFVGTLFDSAFSLNNTGEVVILRNGEGVDISTLAYDVAVGGAGDGNSLQFNDNVWISAKPTPGEMNVKASNSEPIAEAKKNEENTISTNYSEVSTHSGSAPLSSTPTIPKKLAISAGRDRLFVTGSIAQFTASVSVDGKDESAGTHNFAWSFGDGYSSMGREVEHEYKNEGEYVVVLRINVYGQEVVDRVNVKVIPLDINFNVQNESVKIENKSKYEINMGGYILETAHKSFTFPKDIIILPSRTLIIDKELISVGDGKEVMLFSPNKKTIAVAGVVLGATNGPAVEDLQKELARLQEELYKLLLAKYLAET